MAIEPQPHINQMPKKERKSLATALQKLTEGGKALEVSCKSEAELNSAIDLALKINQNNEKTIRSSKKPDLNTVFFYI
ncbi:hypothetical protein [Fodinibius salsisoli]|uniref:Uncharacterized protein n=1 Tax=Fodinibius salsisoli TaxID=2820877 RepID=A0ABT3PRB2_9BACT|nr:hypothetical protein [Fodinibius salsisoli]MCW9708398.1 hypothetical protein [Fodinibius salsisoli]